MRTKGYCIAQCVVICREASCPLIRSQWSFQMALPSDQDPLGPPTGLAGPSRTDLQCLEEKVVLSLSLVFCQPMHLSHKTLISCSLTRMSASLILEHAGCGGSAGLVVKADRKEFSMANGNYTWKSLTLLKGGIASIQQFKPLSCIQGVHKVRSHPIRFPQSLGIIFFFENPIHDLNS